MNTVERIINNQLFAQYDEKAELNWQKHKIKFDDAAQVFEDEERIDYLDEEHSDYEDRYITIGKVDKVLFVVYTDREDITRIISARKADKTERREYYGR